MMTRTALLLALALGAAPVNAGEPRIGDMAPPFTLTLVDGSKVSLADLRGQVVVLNFWATWCAPCIKELPLLNTYYRLSKKNGLSVFAITTQDSVPLYRLKKLFERMAIPSVRHLKGGYADLGGVPTNYIIDRSGRLRYAKAAAFDLESLNEALVPLLNERPPVDTAAGPTTATDAAADNLALKPRNAAR